MNSTIVADTIALIDELYRTGNRLGDGLHIAVDDGNMENADLSFCETRVSTDLERRILANLQAMSKTQRLKTYHNQKSTP